MLTIAHIARTHHRRELPEQFARIAEAGMTGVEIVVGRGCTCELLESEENCRALAEEAGRCGVRIFSALLADDPQARIGAADHRQRGQAIEQIAAVVRRCRWMGAETLRLAPVGGGVRCGETGFSYQDALNHTYDSLQILRLDFERGGVVAGIMPCLQGFLLSPPEFRELLDRVNSPGIKAALDCTACARFGEPADWITTLQYRLTAVYDESTMAERACDDRALLNALDEVRFEGVFICSGLLLCAGSPPDY
ncbi:MAG: TIM barrel protein [Phycisphaerae bacterium]|nr:TIM barrel protein [Phycisphaerae bacterium]